MAQPRGSAPAAAERPRRLTLSEIVERLLARSTSDRSHVLLARNAKGETQVEVKVCPGEEGGVGTIWEAEEVAAGILGRLSSQLQAATPSQQASVELTRNAKGETQVEVQLKAGEGEVEPHTLDEAADAAVVAYDRLRARYPMADGRTAKPGSVAAEGGKP
jgi:hypothetical protein